MQYQKLRTNKDQNLLLKLWLIYLFILIGLDVTDGHGCDFSILIDLNTFLSSPSFPPGDFDFTGGGFGMYSGKGAKNPANPDFGGFDDLNTDSCLYT